MRTHGWRCRSCGRSADDVARERARAGLPALPPGAMACGQPCALALVREAIGDVDSLMVEYTLRALETAGDRDDPAPMPLPRRAAYLHVVSPGAVPRFAPGP